MCIKGITLFHLFFFQVKLLKDQLAKLPAVNNRQVFNIKVSTVDGFQGSECDIIILSCVRSNSRCKKGKNRHNKLVFNLTFTSNNNLIVHLFTYKLVEVLAFSMMSAE
jgi:hypothetical protein